MGRKRKVYQDKFKIDAVREALHSGADHTEVAIKYNIAQSTLSEWITMFLEGKILTD
ncbi:MAG: transposase, partial [Treponema sp.]|nr:transposase [Treponema sp.]